MQKFEKSARYTWVSIQDLTFIFQHFNRTDLGDNLPNWVLYIDSKDKSEFSKRLKKRKAKNPASLDRKFFESLVI